jgi:uncharacterized protein with FMN-binding domain
MLRRIHPTHPDRGHDHFLLISAIVVALLVLLLLAATTAGAADQVELLSGAKVSGEIIDRNVKSVTINVTVSGVTLKRVYPLSSIHRVVYQGREIILNPKGTQGTASSGSGGAASRNSDSATITRSSPAGKSAGKSGGGSRAQLDAQIDKIGRTQPDWYESTRLNYPQSLDLEWPEPAPGGWNNQKNMGQFIWDVINPNPNRWREGIRLMHHLLTVHKDNPQKLNRVMLELGRMYHDLLEDYERSAFWLRAAGVEKNPKSYTRQSVMLAECYWRLGYRDEALKLLAQAPATFIQIKLYADMGDTDRAIRVCEASAANAPADANLYAGDACRLAGRYREALQYYQKVLAVDASGQQAGRIKRYHDRANSNIAAIKYFELFDPKKVPDGSYQASSQGYEGPVEVTVTVTSGTITTVKVSNHREKQFYSSISDTPKKIIAKQNVKGVDTTAGATITSEAIVNATAKALGEAK